MLHQRLAASSWWCGPRSSAPTFCCHIMVVQFPPLCTNVLPPHRCDAVPAPLHQHLAAHRGSAVSLLCTSVSQPHRGGAVSTLLHQCLAASLWWCSPCSSAPTSRSLIVVVQSPLLCTNVSQPHRGGAVPTLLHQRLAASSWWCSLCSSAPTSRSLIMVVQSSLLCTNVSQPHCGGAVPTPLHQRLAASLWWCSPCPSYKWKIEMAMQLSQKVRPSGCPISPIVWNFSTCIPCLMSSKLRIHKCPHLKINSAAKFKDYFRPANGWVILK